MYRILLLVVILSLLMSLSSCNPLVRLVYGIKNPRVENEVTLRKYLNKKDIGDYNIYTVSKEDFKSILALNNNKIPEMMVFNEIGQMIVYREDATCNAGATGFIDQLHPDREYPLSDKTTLSTELGRLRNFDGTPAKFKLRKKRIMLSCWTGRVTWGD